MVTSVKASAYAPYIAQKDDTGKVTSHDFASRQADKSRQTAVTRWSPEILISMEHTPPLDRPYTNLIKR